MRIKVGGSVLASKEQSATPKAPKYDQEALIALVDSALSDLGSQSLLDGSRVSNWLLEIRSAVSNSTFTISSDGVTLSVSPVTVPAR